ncbi:MAG: hypothetical protein JNK76_04985 [Planctomycetales bacterium]|nr:hypothetical protein [Planctomycetales bacterium]
MRAPLAHCRLAVLFAFAPAVALAQQNPFAPTTPAPATQPAASAPAAGAPAAGANPFAAPAPAAGAPAASPAMPAAPSSNPFDTPAPAGTTNPAMPAIPGFTPPATEVKLEGLPAVPVQGPAASGGFRVLAPGVMTTIPSPVSVDDLQSIHDLREIVAELPTYGERESSPGRKPAVGVRFAHDVWGLDFSFKPVRFIRIPGPGGTERMIWYMVYNVRNGPVKRLEYDRNMEPPVKQIPVDKPFLFIPRFELHSFDVNKTYLETIIPEAIAAIQQREDKNRKLLNTAEMTGEIPPTTAEVDRSVWGVVTWEGVDPRTDRFSINVYGLTNAFKWKDAEGGHPAGAPPGTGRTFEQQVLTLNFWRPSDTRFEHENEIRFGIPGEVDYSWSYR